MRHLRSRLTDQTEAIVALGRACFGRMIEIEFVDRAVALASLAFTALIPLGVVTGSVVPSVDRRSLADWLVEEFRLTGDTAQLVHSLFAPPEDVRSAVSIIGVLLVIVAALSFTRALQRVYERSWRLRPLGIRGTPAGLVWILGVVVFFSIFAGLRAFLLDLAGPLLDLVVAIIFSAAIWLLTPHTLLSRRVPWRALVPISLLTAGAMTALEIASVIYIPTAISESAARYGQIGVAIAIVSWLVSCGFVLVTCSAVGAVLADWIGLDAGDAERLSDEPGASEAGGATA